MTHESVYFPGRGTVLFLLPVVDGWKMTGLCCSLANTHVSATPLCREKGGLGRVGVGGAVVGSLLVKSSTMLKDATGYIYIRAMWVCVVVDRKSWWNLRVALRIRCLFTPYSGLACVIRMH